MDIDWSEMQSFMDEARNDLSTHILQAHKKRKGKKKKVQKYNLVAFDSENDEEGNVTVFDFYDGKKHYSFDLVREHSLDDVVRFVYSYSPKEKCVFFAHNLEYDINALLSHCNYAYIDEMLYTARLIMCTMKELPHEFWDSFNFMPTSLKKIAKMLGMNKGNFEEAAKDQDENILYCQSDTEITWEFVNQFQDRINDELAIKIYPTVGKMAMETFRTHFLKDDIDAVSNELALKAYYGGRVEVFFKGKIEGDIRVSDVNSMYPYVMTYNYPDTSTMEKSSIKTHEFGIGTFTVYCPEDMYVPILPYRSGGRLYFPTGEFTGAWTYAEVRYALEKGYSLLEEHGDGMGTDIGINFFEEYIRFFYKKRMSAKKTKDTFGIGFFKLLMNNLYGKFNQHSDKITITTIPRSRPNEILERTLGPFYVFKEPCIEPPSTSNYVWGTHVTSFARIYLHSILSMAHKEGHTLLYCDTDSIMFEKKKGGKIPWGVGSKLGELDEERYVKANFINPKGYFMYDKNGGLKLASKGVPSDHGLEFLTTGSTIFKKPVKMRESFIENLQVNFWRDVEKRMNSIYIKRKGEGTTYPISVLEIPEQEEKLKKHLQSLDK